MFKIGDIVQLIAFADPKGLPTNDSPPMRVMEVSKVEQNVLVGYFDGNKTLQTLWTHPNRLEPYTLDWTTDDLAEYIAELQEEGNKEANEDSLRRFVKGSGIDVTNLDWKQIVMRAILVLGTGKLREWYTAKS